MAQQMGREEKRETINISSSTSDARGVQVFILKLKIQDLAFSKNVPIKSINGHLMFPR